MNPAVLVPSVDPEKRRRKKIAEARRLGGTTPKQGIEMGSDLTAFGRELAERARRAKH